jgi:CRISPR/Cas system-associated exonuclease Cas4 (RecB family)
MSEQNIEQHNYDNIYDEIDTPQKIVKFLERKNGIKQMFDSKKYSVTELVKCSRQIFYKKNRTPTEEILEETIGGMWCSVRGEFLHKITTAYSWNELETEYSVILDDNKTATVVGRLDMYDEKTKTILDLKTTNNVRWQAKRGILLKPEHVKQIQIYYTMFSKLIPVEHLNLVYADMTDIITYTIPLKDRSKWIANKIQIIETDIENGLIPPGEVTRKCQFCKYQTRCEKQGEGLDKKST